MKNGNRRRAANGDLAALFDPVVDRIDTTVKARLREEPFQRDPKVVQACPAAH